MEEQKDRISFRTDKKSEALSGVKVNKFGHTTTSKEPEIVDSAVQLRVGGTSGVEAYVDIFDSPTMKQFMQQNNLDLENKEPVTTEIIELDEEEETLDPRGFVRPDTLEEFDMLADEMIGIKASPNQPKKIFAQTQADVKTCNSCQCKNKSNSKFCSNCGRPFTLAQFCKNCGNKFDSQEKFCIECGTKRE